MVTVSQASALVKCTKTNTYKYLNSIVLVAVIILFKCLCRQKVRNLLDMCELWCFLLTSQTRGIIVGV